MRQRKGVSNYFVTRIKWQQQSTGMAANTQTQSRIGAAAPSQTLQTHQLTWHRHLRAMLAIPALHTNNSDFSARIVNTILSATKINKSESMVDLQASDCTTTAGGVQIDDLENWKLSRGFVDARSV
jgi:hypothetical protein